MPRYFFHTADGSRDRDTDGTELANLNDARKEAVRYAGAVLQDDPDKVWSGGDFRIEVTDEHGMALFTVITLAIDAAAVWDTSADRKDHD